MTTRRTQRSRFYEGAFYAHVMEPMLRNLHGFVAKQVEPGELVLDVGSGAGGLALRMAEGARAVVGVELAPAMAAYAERRRQRAGVSNVTFVEGDAARALADRPAGAFDVATIVLALHEMPADVRGPVLREVTRLARRVVCLDFRVPMPRNLAGLRNRLFEVLAGPTHFRAFRDFVRRGGVPGVAREAGVVCEPARDVDAGTLSLCVLRTKALTGQ